MYISITNGVFYSKQYLSFIALKLALKLHKTILYAIYTNM